MAIKTQTCNVNTNEKAPFGKRNFDFELKVGTGQTLAELANDVKALGIHESQVCSMFWSQFVTNAQNVARPYFRTEKELADSKDAKGVVVLGAVSKAKQALAKFIEHSGKPAGEGREVSEATAKRRNADKQTSAINQLGNDIKAGNVAAKSVQNAIMTSKSGLGCLASVALEYVANGAPAAVKLAQAS